MYIVRSKSERPSRVFSYNKAIDFINKHNFSSIIDYACGVMRLLEYINPNSVEYTGVDVIKDRLNEGLSKFQNSHKINCFNCSILDFKLIRKYDLVICLETLGFNSWFDKKEIFSTINKLISSNTKHGHTIFNIYSDNTLLVENAINYTKLNYNNVNVTKYGNFTELVDRELCLFIYENILKNDYLSESDKVYSNMYLFECSNKI